ncbi:MAG: rhomboid family intramembrane serine protease [Bacteroidetes bacterium]|nr:rhomboid family intramembrane serine protease [Bacteroidota bacterium]
MLEESPVASVILILILGPGLYGLLYDGSLIRKWMLSPYSVKRGEGILTLVTSGFVHADWGHLLFNLISFFFFAFPLEKTIGSLDFFLVYSLSLVISILPDMISQRDNPNYATLGASGAISGVIYSFILFYPMTEIYLFLIPVGIPAWLFALLYLAGSALAARYQWGNINHSAHFTGAVTGALVTFLLFPDLFREWASFLFPWF